MKTIVKKLNEALKDTDKGIIEYLQFQAKFGSGLQQALFTKKAQDADSIDIVAMKDILTPEEIKNIKKQGIKLHECYRNAFVAGDILSFDHEIRYCEGYMNVYGIPIEHAFLKVDDKYIDPTAELAIKKENIFDDTYVLLGEFTLNEVREIIVENGFWGQVYDYTFFKKYKENTSEAK